MVAYLFSIALLALGASAVPAPTATVNEAANHPHGSLSYTHAATILGGGAAGTAGPAGGEVAGTLVDGTVTYAGGHATGKAGTVSGEVIGTVYGDGSAYGCVEGGIGSKAYTLCGSIPAHAAKATPTPTS